MGFIYMVFIINQYVVMISKWQANPKKLKTYIS
jgi:hypothetical protein